MYSFAEINDNNNGSRNVKNTSGTLVVLSTDNTSFDKSPELNRCLNIIAAITNAKICGESEN